MFKFPPFLKKIWRKKIILPVVVSILVYGIGFFVFVEKINTVSNVTIEDDVKTAIILTGGTGRIKKGLTLLKEEKISLLFISGVHKTIDVKELLKVTQSFPNKADCCIKLGYNADSTYQNAVEVYDFVKKNSIKKFYLISNTFHLPRALKEVHFRLRALDYTVDVIPYPVRSRTLHSENAYRSLSTFFILAQEYTKFILVTLRTTLLRFL